MHISWSLASAKQNHVGGQVYTAWCYEEGEGVELDLASAFEWWWKAAEQDNEVAQYNIGEYFELGTGRDF